MKDKLTGRPRGFGFVVFADPSLLEHVLQDMHVIDGRTVEAKRALSREEQHTTAKASYPGRSAGGGSGGSMRTKKIFVGGLPPTLTEDDFRQYFENYGTVTDVVVMYDQTTQRPRGFGFITFDTEDAVELALHKTFHELAGKNVEVKKALPKDANPSNGGGGAGSYQPYGGSISNATSYDGRMDTNRYMQPPTAGSGYPSYGSSGYGNAGYGYAAAGTGYGAYGMPGYGNATSGYGPAGTYGNPNSGGYGSGPQGAPRSPWNNQTSSVYNSSGYGSNTGYGTAGSNGSAAPTGQSSDGPGYGSQSYGYGGGYGGEQGVGPYANHSGYGAVGGRSGGISGVGGGGEQGVGSGYMGGGYSDSNATGGYSSSWKDPSQGGSYGATQVNVPPGAGNYGGYGGPQTRQPQQQ
ncbi:hypothetical protein ZOSMA_103G00850 [Zostera marina]|uniref:RRM domain-containing protein n=1 Tax=Zostera marina TaxID=29655 RepID=A0A0K9Q5B6_ZOSMR|nr:hypothetical protein ZOSMA_103G00850 [Zostera marina]